MSDVVEKETPEVDADTSALVNEISDKVREISGADEDSLMQPEQAEDDALLAQIDAFRAKAKELSGLIQGRQEKVADIEDLVQSRERQNEELKSELELTRKQYREIEAQLDQQISAMRESLKADLKEMTDGIESRAAEMNTPVLEKVDSISEAVSGVKETVTGVNDTVSGMKGEIFEKVHTESVQSYKNLQEFIKENDKSDELKLSLTTSIESLKGKVTFLSVVLIVNLGITVCILLHMFGIF